MQDKDRCISAGNTFFFGFLSNQKFPIKKADKNYRVDVPGEQSAV